MQQYLTSQKILHWLTALLIIGLFALGVWMRTLGYYDGWYQTAPHWHKQIGIILLVLMVARLIWRFIKGTPKALSSHSTLEKRAAHWVHGILYLGVFAIIASGYLIATADNRGIEVLGFITLPVLFPPIENQEDIAGLIHEWGAYALMAFVAIHALGALKHHYFDKDQTLKRML